MFLKYATLLVFAIITLDVAIDNWKSNTSKTKSLALSLIGGIFISAIFAGGYMLSSHLRPDLGYNWHLGQGLMAVAVPTALLWVIYVAQRVFGKRR
jgi:hypothetical protein